MHVFLSNKRSVHFSGGILITVAGTNLDSVAEPIMAFFIVVNDEISVYYQVLPLFCQYYYSLLLTLQKHQKIQTFAIFQRKAFVLNGETYILNNTTQFREDLKEIYVSLRLHVQNAVPAQPCVGKLEISLVLLNFLHCNFR